MSAFTYYGGKTLYAAEIADVLEREVAAARAAGRRVTRYVEPFCGWCSVTAEVASRGALGVREHVASDNNQSVVALWRALSRGRFRLPDKPVTREDWVRLRDSKPSALKGFVGVVWSFNGRFFNSYRPPLHPDASRLLDRGRRVRGVTFAARSFDDPEYLRARGCVFYMDPPYQTRKNSYVRDGTGTKGYGVVIKTFDHARFWDVARALAAHNVVVVSEYTAPPDWRCVAVLGKRGHRGNSNLNCVNDEAERLFVHDPRRRPPAPPAAPAAAPPRPTPKERPTPKPKPKKG